MYVVCRAWGVAINNIVEEVTRRLPPLPLYIDRPLGCDSELEEAILRLEIDSAHATCLMLGIHGDDEISKFVAELYNKIRPHFGTASLLSNISNQDAEEDDVDKGDVVGFTNITSFVIEKLRDDNINVVSIIGMGGLGKTTLAQKIFDEKEVKDLFPFRGWSRVSKDYKPREVWLELLDSLKLSTLQYQNSTEEHLKKIVRYYLKEKTFPNESNGSKILMTSRNEGVANVASLEPYKLPLLDEKGSWELFCKRVFSVKKCPPDLEPPGRSIVESCGGLPLAIVVIAGVVAKKKRLESEWNGVKESIHWHLTRDMIKVMNVLKLSYG
ncbi:hypothetical protein PIB30_068714 [Stylosanthes scabra]|uniref:NB-ARC domain-containing protein n=1 Tax=Stylosanthes scabra TaxID=79078 RepID=A0ABU6VLE1_9FABA|nr:hypothetical protein [Stylosanthes scabra]